MIGQFEKDIITLMIQGNINDFDSFINNQFVLKEFKLTHTTYRTKYKVFEKNSTIYILEEEDKAIQDLQKFLDLILLLEEKKYISLIPKHDAGTILPIFRFDKDKNLPKPFTSFLEIYYKHKNKKIIVNESLHKYRNNKFRTEEENKEYRNKILKILIPILIAFIGLIPFIYNKIFPTQKTEFKLNNICFHPDSPIEIKVFGEKTISERVIIVSLDDYRLDECLARFEDCWQFYPSQCNLPDVALKDGEHILNIRLHGSDKPEIFKIYFDSKSPSVALQRFVDDDSSATFVGKATDIGLQSEDNLNVNIFLWNGDKYERTKLPVNKYTDKSGNTIWSFQTKISKIPRLKEDDPNYSKTFCMIHVNDKAMNLAAYELPYSQVFAKGISRTIIGDTEILMGQPNDASNDWIPKRYKLNLISPPMKTEESITKEFALVIYVFSTKYAEIGIKNLPVDATGEITYYKNNKKLQKTKKETIIDYDVESGGFYEYYATVKGKGDKTYKTNVAYTIESEMAYIKGGKFLMGSNYEFLWWTKPVHEVQVRDFYISKYEVTQMQWKAIMGNNPSHFKGDFLPVENVSWLDCQEFITRLNKISGKNFRLPNEAEWEFACRASSETEWFFGNNENELANYGWYKKNSKGRTHKIGELLPNPFGLYDICGNVFEWTSDVNYRYPYVQRPIDFSDGIKVSRGGCHKFDHRYCMSAVRYGWKNSNSTRREILGLRLAMSAN